MYICGDIWKSGLALKIKVQKEILGIMDKFLKENPQARKGSVHFFTAVPTGCVSLEIPHFTLTTALVDDQGFSFAFDSDDPSFDRAEVGANELVELLGN